MDEGFGTRYRRRRSPARFPTALVLGIAAGVVAAGMLALVAILLTRSGSNDRRPSLPQPPSAVQFPAGPRQPPPGGTRVAPAPLLRDQSGVPLAPVPPPGLENMERIWMLFNPPGNKPVEELTFNGPVGPPHSYSHEVSNIGTLEGQAPPAGLLQPPFLAEARESGRAGRGRRGARHGAFFVRTPAISLPHRLPAESGLVPAGLSQLAGIAAAHVRSLRGVLPEAGSLSVRKGGGRRGEKPPQAVHVTSGRTLV